MALPTMSRPANRWQTFQALLHLPKLVRLYWRLFRDSRVPLWPKALLVGALAYVVLPFDFIPDMFPIVGQVDDLVIVLAAAHWFLQGCPPAVVSEHARALGARAA
jgi:uncharacterized membrane protein YkvA (DUF1232 family)